jgi:hypothetical protein
MPETFNKFNKRHLDLDGARAASGRRSGDEIDDAIDDPAVVDPGPVPGGGDKIELRARQRRGVVGGELGRQIGVALAPDDQRRTGEAVEVGAGLGEPVRVGVAVEGQRRPPGPAVPVVPDRVDELRGNGRRSPLAWRSRRSMPERVVRRLKISPAGRRRQNQRAIQCQR